MTIGGLLHALHVPFSGALLAAIGAAILACQRSLCPARGITLTTGCVAAGIKVFSLGGIYLNPLLAVLAEALLAEGVFSLFGAGFCSAGVAGFLMGLWSFAQGLLTLILLYGTHWMEASAAALSRQAPSWPLSPAALLSLAALLLAGLPASGGLLGLWSARRLTGTAPGSPLGLGREGARG
jgi:hypothetical protein